MPLPRQILFPVDFSDRCLGAAQYAEAFTREFRAELTLLHVSEPVDYLYGAPEFGGPALRDTYTARRAHAEERLTAFLAAELRGSKVKRVLLEGDAAREIVRYAEQHGADLIVLPSHGLGTFRRFIIGSVTAKVLHDAKAPVWTGVHMESAPPVTEIAFRRVVCAVDLSSESECVVEWAGQFAAHFSAELTLVHATPAVEPRPAKYLDTDYAAALDHMAREEMHKLRERLGVDAEIRVSGGNPAAVVHEVALEEKADLVVIGRGGVQGSGIGRLRAHAYAIIRQSPSPVVSV